MPQYTVYPQTPADPDYELNWNWIHKWTQNISSYSMFTFLTTEINFAQLWVRLKLSISWNIADLQKNMIAAAEKKKVVEVC